MIPSLKAVLGPPPLPGDIRKCGGIYWYMAVLLSFKDSTRDPHCATILSKELMKNSFTPEAKNHCIIKNEFFIQKNFNQIYFFFLFLMAVPMAYWNFQVRDPIRAAAAGLNHSLNNTRSKSYLQPTAPFMAMPDP